MLTTRIFPAKKGLTRPLPLVLLLTATALTTVEAAPDDIPAPSPTTPLHYDQLPIRQVGQYEVHSGVLRHIDNSETGSLIAVKRPDGAVIAIIEQDGISGLMLITGDGETVLLPDKPDDFDKVDTLPTPAIAQPSAETSPSRPGAPSPPASDPPNERGPKIIEMLAGFSRSAADHVGDAQAYALAQVESVNLALHNSKVLDVSLELAGIQI
ncbi:MAG: hypothetical protein JWP80_1420, partial [Pseudomonas sp.]|nr:hypothetical protein [Pseudomonas sp.]